MTRQGGFAYVGEWERDGTEAVPYEKISGHALILNLCREALPLLG